MSDDELTPDESWLVDVLLQHAISTEPFNDDDRISELMRTIRSTSSGELSSMQRIMNASETRSRLCVARWVFVPLTTALAIAAMLFVPVLLAEKRAYAAVERSLAAERLPGVRQYAVTLVTGKKPETIRHPEFQLFIKQHSFVIRLDALVGDDFHWLGGNPDQRWIVPRIGPVLTGAEGLLGRWTRRRKALAAPFLGTSTILQRLQRFYDLEMEPAVLLTSSRSEGPEVKCDHVVGIRQASASLPRIPDRIDLWADCNAGFARRVDLHWNSPTTAAGLTSATVELVGTPTVAHDFFDHSGHHAADRRIIRGPAVDEVLGK
jgi:hypothetical protein